MTPTPAHLLDPLVREVSEHVVRPTWETSLRGNLTRVYGRGLRLTVYPRPRGGCRYGWAIARGNDVIHSPGTFASEQEAAEAVMVVAQKLDADDE